MKFFISHSTHTPALVSQQISESVGDDDDDEEIRLWTYRGRAECLDEQPAYYKQCRSRLTEVRCLNGKGIDRNLIIIFFFTIFYLFFPTPTLPYSAESNHNLYFSIAVVRDA